MDRKKLTEINVSKSEWKESNFDRYSSIPIPMNKENLNETFDSYSLLFDKNEHNFTTSSEISLLNRSSVIDTVLLSIHDDRTILKDSSPNISESSTSEDTFLSANSSLHSENDNDRGNSCITNNDSSNTRMKVEIDQRDYDHSSHLSIVNRSIHKKKTHEEQQESKNFQANRNILHCQQDKRLGTNESDVDDDQAFEKFLQEHGNPTNTEKEEKAIVKNEQENGLSRRLRPKRRNSLKDFICDSSEEDEESANLHRRVNCLIDRDSPWRETDEIYQSDSSDDLTYETSSSSSEEEAKPSTAKNKKASINFLESLSSHVPIEEKHADAKQYFHGTAFKPNKKRQELADRLFSVFDQDVFSSKLANKVTVVWSGRLTATAGHCTTRRSSLTATITLSNKVCDSPERCRDTLLHEMCHAAVSLIDGAIEHGHGQLWRQWTKRAEHCYPYLPRISIKHTYEINYKYIYRCIKCSYEVQRHSKSLNVDTDICGKCRGRFELLVNRIDSKNGIETPKRPPNRYNLFIKEHFQTMKLSHPSLSTPQLMKELSQRYKKKIQEENHIDLPDLNQLKI